MGDSTISEKILGGGKYSGGGGSPRATHLYIGGGSNPGGPMKHLKGVGGDEAFSLLVDILSHSLR